MSCSQVKASIGHGQIKTKEIRYGFYEVIDQLEHMAREPADILDELQKDLSTRDLQLVLVYFSQEGRDSWCVLEVFDWMRKVDRVDDETMDLMLSIMSSWLAKLVEEEHSVEEVQILLTEMKCVGLVLNYDMVETLISLYWDRGKRLEASRFVKYLLEFGAAVVEDEKDKDPTAYLMWKMSKGGEHREVVNLIFDLRNCDLKPKIDSYLTALMAVVMEQNQFTRALHELEVFQRKGKVGELEKGEIEAFDSYQRDLHKEGEQIAKWAIEENMPEIMGQIHERLAAMYMVAVRSAKAEHHLWQMKLAGREPTIEMYDAVLAVCAVEKNLQAVGRIMAGMEVAGKIPGKKTFSWLVRGYVKGGHFEEAAKALMDMIKKGLHPANLETMVVLKGLQKNHLQNGYTEPYLNLCKSLYTADCKGAQDIFQN
ncbi:hypothetical protein SUGI_0761730 [Cryptomeria japonica]|nr:hypothetical protein SUGI_0761730 [Cryptomeria japonica]